MTPTAALGQDVWTEQTSGVDGELEAAFFMDEQTGWVAGEEGAFGPGAILKTTDGGQTWSPQDVPDSAPPLYDVFFLDDTTGWASGAEETVLHTTDGGATWTVMHEDPDAIAPKRFRSIYFTDASTGWVATGDLSSSSTELLAWTDDAGTTWTEVDLDVEVEDFFALQFVTADVGYVAGRGEEGDPLVLKTDDGGTTWTRADAGLTEQVNGLHFIDASTGWVCGDEEMVAKTEDGGATWTLQQSPSTNNGCTGISFVDADHGWFVGPLAYEFTTDGGATWTGQEGFSLGQLLDVDFVSEEAGWAVGYNGAILKWAATTTSRSADAAVPEGYVLRPNYPNPFNPSTTITYAIPHAERVTLSVYDALGRKVRDLVTARQTAGEHTVQFQADGLPSGTYWYRLKTASTEQIGTMLLVK